jgi:fatty-acyl-CoA synthase
MAITGKIAAAAALARTNLALFERPDRLARAMLSSAPWGLTTSAMLAAAAQRTPDRAAVIDGERTLTYRALWSRSSGIAAGLLDAGAGPGTAVGVLCRNGSGFVQAVAAVGKTGADLVLLNTGFAGPQLNDVIASEGITMVLHDDEFAELLDPHASRRFVDGSTADAWAASGRRAPPTRHQGRTVILTSGTTGRPKGASRRPDASAVEGVTALVSRIPLRAGDVQVIAAPLFHAWGFSHLLLGFGRCATSVVAPRFDAAGTLQSIENHRARVLVAVPAMMQRIAALHDGSRAAGTSSIRVIALSGSTLGGHLASTLADRFGPVVYNAYGSTEVSIATVATPADLRRYPSTVGQAAPGVRIAIFDSAGQPVPAGTPGRIFVGNPSRFDGYTSGETKQSIGALMSSGDVGHFNADGFLFVDGRDDEMIVSGGENVFPGEIEELLAAHPAILEVAVVGVDDARFGQVLAAFVVRKAGAQLSVSDVKAYVATNLARFKSPKTVNFVERLPRNQAGKVLKRELRPPAKPGS